MHICFAKGKEVCCDSFFVYEPKLMVDRLMFIVSFETVKYRAQGGKILRISQSRNLGVMCIKNDI